MKKMILIFTLVFTLFTFSLGASLSDIQDHWVVLNIMKATNDEFFSGYPDGTFKPINNITRAEASVIIVELFDNKDLIKDVQWKNESPYVNTEVIRTEPEEVVLQTLLNESKDNYSRAYQYLSSIYKEDNEISNSSY